MENENYEIIPRFGETIFNNGISDLIKDYAELGIDAVINDGALNGFPIVSTFLAVGKTAIAIRDRHFIKKTIIFAQQLQNGTASTEAREEHRRYLEENPRLMEKELESIIICIDRYRLELKCKILANFYSACIAEELEWDDFELFKDILDMFNVYDINELKQLSNKEYYGQNDSFDSLVLARLSGLGLARYFNGMFVTGRSEDDCEIDTPVMATRTKLGSTFCKIGLRNISE